MKGIYDLDSDTLLDGKELGSDTLLGGEGI